MEEAKGKLSLTIPLPHDFLFDFVISRSFSFPNISIALGKTQELCHDKTERDFDFTANNCIVF